jgi:C4-dicarboxylate-specific signal transduction histidine kinase
VSTIVTDFLDFTRPRPARVQVLRTRELVEDLKASWETDPRGAGLSLECGEPPDVEVLGDPVWVHQIFTNLLSNARKALKQAPDPRIRLACRLRPGTLAVSVSDNGCGMGPERLRSVFMPFASGFEEGPDNPGLLLERNCER